MNTAQSLALANEVRLERASLCREIGSPADAAAAIRTCTNGIQVRKVLLAIPRWGDRKVDAVMMECDLNFWAKLGGERKGVATPITDRQRRVVAEFLESL